MQNNTPDITQAWREYQTGLDYNSKIGYFANVDRNWQFYNGNQWIGVPKGDLPLPVFNIIKRCINYFVSSIMSRKTKAQYRFENIPDAPEDPNEQEDPRNEELRQVAELLTNVAELKWEKEKMDTHLRKQLLRAANSGDMCAFVYWDSTIETGQEAKGDFVTEIVNGGNVFFGNPNEPMVEKQPYILITGRDSVVSLREEAKRNGVPDDQIKNIVRDTQTEYQAGERGKVELEQGGEDTGAGKCLYIWRLWKKDGKVWATKSTRLVDVRKSVSLDVRKYPLAWGNWEEIINSYHGQACATGILPNQIYINKQFAMTMLWLMNMAYGKVIYDSTRITSWSNQLNVAIPVDGDTTAAVQQLNPGAMNGNVITLIDKVIQYTKDMLGANDSALGDINPEQASGQAIIATQKQSSVPLEGIQANLYQFVEDIYNIWGEFILAKYTADRQVTMKKNGKLMTTTFNSSQYRDLLLSVSVDVGPSTYWSEVASMQTLDALLNGGKIDILQYLERIPNGIIPQKQELIEELKQQIEQQKAMEAQATANPPIEIQTNAEYEQMAQFVESLPEELQAQLQAMPPDEMEAAVREYMMQTGGLQNG